LDAEASWALRRDCRPAFRPGLSELLIKAASIMNPGLMAQTYPPPQPQP